MAIYVSLLVWLAGLLLYLAAMNPKVQELGRLMFGFGLLVWLLLFDKILTVLRW